ncbi:MAG TPA: pyridoxamine 5'-phosphate oxidase family protein [Acidocella sp.]|nr:pyridoxamine 5'-phosphate oxidase family protein [Acidocella sp.]HQU05578.1 pyridoxamine 5'-phosphate oxidase family protein [Acidocella sp.]
MNAPFDPLNFESALDFTNAALGFLARGVKDRRSALHIIGLGSTGLDGTPQLRNVVLRGLDVSNLTLTFHTDKRAAKFAELVKNPQAAVLAYDPGAKLQIRLSGVVRLHNADQLAAKTWGSMQATSQACYFTPTPPGTSVKSAALLSEAEAMAQFTVCIFDIIKLDILYLLASGHKRTISTCTAGSITAEWVAP